ncbi:hypothetical protein OD657_004872 [Salmonella enterica]|nr:hypothetical protein [Salmonella enterica]EJX4431173.1 hypothetical protein [Salmonella enterica]EJX4862491.1 hypothetical protein [Salmonella enterica]EJX4928250.1 hypothetical protein [Salmonella enterica]EKC3541140.1 hypothetical protein [Salmonella enterica]
MSFVDTVNTVQKITSPDCAGENQRYGTGQLAAEDDETPPEMQIQTSWLKNELC